MYLRPRSLLAVIFPGLAIVFGVAWWTIWKEKPSARFWGITASIIFILTPIRAKIFFSMPILRSGVVLAVGIVGLILFSRRDVMKIDTSSTDGNDHSS
jgi:hypothetical protein